MLAMQHHLAIVVAERFLLFWLPEKQEPYPKLPGETGIQIQVARTEPYTAMASEAAAVQCEANDASECEASEQQA